MILSGDDHAVVESTQAIDAGSSFGFAQGKSFANDHKKPEH